MTEVRRCLTCGDDWIPESNHKLGEVCSPCRNRFTDNLVTARRSKLQWRGRAIRICGTAEDVESFNKLGEKHLKSMADLGLGKEAS